MKLFLASLIDYDDIKEFEPTHFTSLESMDDARQKALDWLNEGEISMESGLVWTLETMMSDETWTISYNEQELEV